MQSDLDRPMDDEEDNEEPQPDQSTDGIQVSLRDYILSTLFAMQSGGGPHASGGGETQPDPMPAITLQDISRLLNTVGRGGAIRQFRLDPDEDEDEDEDGEEDDDYYSSFHSASIPPWRGPVTTEPQRAGVELLNSGEFGRIGIRARQRRNDLNISNLVLNRARRLRPGTAKEDLSANLVPNSRGTAVAVCDHNIYTGQYSADSSFYYTCSQDFKLHVFDTTQPIVPGAPLPTRSHQHSDMRSTMKIRKSIQGNPGRWTITDANLSPDNERMIYSSITSTAFMTNVLDDSHEQIPIPFFDPRRDRPSHFDSFGIWSCRFSADGNEIVAGGSGKIFVYDLLANKRTVSISAHADDVNSCCWADTSSGNVLVSASDDTFLKVWDRRSLGASQKPSGVLIGHAEGITYVSAKGDGRYLISNGKDQSVRLWDLRKMRSSQEYESVKDTHYGAPHFDYRYPPYPGPRVARHPKDCSVMSYYGHTVMRTLIRCHFSPMETTGSQYIYSGSSDGRVHIWSLDGRVVQVLDRRKTWPMSFDPSAPEIQARDTSRLSPCVRDVSWHSEQPTLMSAAWEGNSQSGSTVAKHEWKGLLKMRGALEDWVEKDKQEREDRSRLQRSHRIAHSRRVPGAYNEDSEYMDSDSE